MPAPIEVSFHRFDPPTDVRDKIESLLPQLDRYEDHIVGGRVVVDGTAHQGNKTVLEIAVELNLRGKTVVGKRTAEYPNPAGQRTFNRAATEAFRAAQGQIKEHVHRQRHDVKAHEHTMVRGRILSLDRDTDSGFVELPNGTSLFFAATVVAGNYDGLAEGDMVRIVPAADDSPYGPQAAEVVPEGPDEATG